MAVTTEILRPSSYALGGSGWVCNSPTYAWDGDPAYTAIFASDIGPGQYSQNDGTVTYSGFNARANSNWAGAILTVVLSNNGGYAGLVTGDPGATVALYLIHYSIDGGSTWVAIDNENVNSDGYGYAFLPTYTLNMPIPVGFTASNLRVRVSGTVYSLDTNTTSGTIWINEIYITGTVGEHLAPSSYTENSYPSCSSLSSAYDGNGVTAAWALRSGSAASGSLSYYAFGTKSTTWGAAALKILFGIPSPSPNPGFGGNCSSGKSHSVYVEWSTDSWSTVNVLQNWTFNGTGGGANYLAPCVMSWAIPSSIDTSVLKVRIRMVNPTDSSPTPTIYFNLAEMWLEGYPGIAVNLTAGVGKSGVLLKAFPRLYSASNSATPALSMQKSYLRAATAALSRVPSMLRGIGFKVSGVSASSAALAKIASSARALVASTLLAATLGFVRGKFLSAAQSFSAGLQGQRSRLMSAAQSSAATLGKVRLAFLNAAVASVPTLKRGIAWVKATGLTAGATLAKIFQKLMVSTPQGSVPSLTRGSAVVKVLVVGFVMQVAMIRSMARRFAATSATAGLIKTVPGKILVYQASITTAIVRSVGKIIPILAALSVTLLKLIPRTAQAGSVTVSKMVRSLGYTLAPPIVATVETITKTANKVALASASVVGAVYKGLARVATATQTSVASLYISKLMARVLSATVSFVLFMGKTTLKALSDTANMSGSFSLQALLQRVLTQNTTPSATLRLAFPRRLAAVATATATLARRLKSTLLALSSSAASVLRGGIPILLSAASGVWLAISKGRGKGMAAVQASVSTIGKIAGRTFTAVVGSTAKAIRLIWMALSDMVLLNEQLNLSFSRAFSASVSAVSGLFKGRVVTRALSVLSALAASISASSTRVRSLVVSVAQLATLAELERFYRSLSASVFSAAALSNRMARALAAAVSSTAGLWVAKLSARLLSAGSTLTATAQKSALRVMSVVYTTTATIKKSAGKFMNAALVSSPTLSKGWTKIMTAVLNPAASVLFNLMGIINQKFYVLGATLRRYLRG